MNNGGNHAHLMTFNRGETDSFNDAADVQV